MPKLKTSETSFDPDELEGVEYNEEDYQTYVGPPPPGGIILNGFIKRMWLTETKAGADMLVVLFEAKENVGGYAKYDSWGTWERLALQANTKFRWQPFLDATGLTLKQLKTQMYTEEEEDGTGLPIEKIGNWVPGEDSDEAYIRIVTKNDYYNGERRAIVGKFLEWDDPQGPEDEEEEEEEPTPTRKTSRRTSSTSSQPAKAATRGRSEPDPDDDENEDEENEQEEEGQAPPPRSRRAAAKPAASTARTRTPARAAAKPAARTATGRGRGRGGSTEEPPF